MNRRSDEGSVLVESLATILLMGFVLIIVGLVVASANRSIVSARRHSYAVSLLAEHVSVAQRVDCTTAASRPSECDPPSGWIVTLLPLPVPDPEVPQVIGRQVAGEAEERGIAYTVKWIDDYEAPLGHEGSVRSRRAVWVTWTHLGTEHTRSVEVLGPAIRDPSAVAWLSWPVRAPRGSAGDGVYYQNADEFAVQPRFGGGEWLIALPDDDPLTPRPLTLCTPAGGGCASPPLGRTAEFLPGGICEDAVPALLVSICPR